MFHVGRYDPTAEVRPSQKADRRSKRKADSKEGPDDPPLKGAADGDNIDSNKRAKDDNQSSSVPTSSDDSSDSSSVPSSSSDDEHEGDTQTSTTLKVIAPSQPVADDARRRVKKRGAAEDEAIDDFDADFDIIEDSGKSSLASNAHDSAATRALHLSRLSIAEVASEKHWGLPPFLIRNLEADSYEKFFPIQCMVIPDVIESERNAHLRGARDVCCHAPTG